MFLFKGWSPALTTAPPVRRAGVLSAVLALAASVLLSCGPGKEPGDGSSAGDLSGSGGAASALSAPVGFLVSPSVVGPGDTVRVVAAFESDPGGRARLTFEGPGGPVKPMRTRKGGGPPFWRSAEFRAGEAGTYTAGVMVGKVKVAGEAIDVPAKAAAGIPRRGVWQSREGWSRPWENLYSAWLEALFLDSDERASWDTLHAVMRDPGRNLLYDHLGLGEDEDASPNRVDMTPDCADNPFYLRTYFAWKLGLPFGFHECAWGSLEVAPRAERWWTNVSVGAAGNAAQRFRYLLPMVENVVHAGNGRTAFRAEGNDYYPLPLTRKDLRPGTVFADPYGHTLTIVRWVPQTSKRPGLLLAVDAQPDGTIGIKRFWRGNFLFVTKGVVGEPGFKAFRPIVLEGGQERLMTNAEIAASPEYGNYSLEQEKMEPDVFYGAMERLINPAPLDAESAFQDLFRALQEQLIVRVESVGNGENYMKSHPGSVIPMPVGGSAVFQTTGLWEDFSTPNRDLRLLIAIDTILGFPDKAAADPEAYRIPSRKTAADVKERLLELQEKWGRAMSITYERSDGTPQAVTLGEILERRDALEMGYNPNDCAEVRWGAPPGSPEMASCRRRAPAYQLARMNEMRRWFRERLHPPT